MKTLLLLILFCVSLTAGAQELQVAIGKVHSNFEFENAQGASLDNLNGQSDTQVLIGARFNLGGESLKLTTGFIYTGYGSHGSDSLDNFFKWETDYVGLYAGLDYLPVSFNRFDVIVSAAFSGQLLAQGEQITNTTVLDIKGVGEFDNTAFFYHLGLGLDYNINDHVKALLRYSYSKSLALKEDTTQGTSALNITANTLSLGLSFNIGSKKTTNDDTPSKN